MTNEELKNILKSTGYPVAYNHFTDVVEPPFIAFLRVNNENISADNKVYHKLKNYQVELYTRLKDSAIEENLENILDNANIFYNVTETWLDSENLYQIIYEIQI